MKRTHSGFTLVELLVVITIIGILAGLLLPAINAAREAARRAQCSTQVKNLALAAVQYEGAKGEFPGWCMSYGTYDGSGPAIDPGDPGAVASDYGPHAKIGTWAVALLPYLDAQPIYERWNEDRYPVLGSSDTSLSSRTDDRFSGDGYNTNSCPNLGIMQCPSTPGVLGDHGKNSYITNNGMHHLQIDGSVWAAPAKPGVNPFAMAPFQNSQDKANGVFNNKFGGANDLATGERVRIDDLKDGQGFTALVSENLQAMPWHRAGWMLNSPPGSDFNPSDNDMAPGGDPTAALYDPRSRFTNGMVWHYEDPDLLLGAADVHQSHKINGGDGQTDKFNIQMPDIVAGGAPPYGAADYARPSSAHNDGVNMGFADGAVRFILDRIDYRVYQAMLTPRGKSSTVPFNEYILDEEVLGTQ